MLERAEMTTWLRELGLADYDALWEWSVADIARFWRRIWDRYGVTADGDPTVALADASMPGARWFPDVALSFPEHVFAGKADDNPAVYFASESRPLDRADEAHAVMERGGHTGKLVLSIP